MAKDQDKELEARRRKIVAAMLSHVPLDGWTEKALHAGARDAGLTPGDADAAFPGAMAEVAEYFSTDADNRMTAALTRRSLQKLKIRERIALAVRLRLEQNAHLKEALRHLLGFLALPQNAALALECMYRTVDAMWRGIGDTSTDFNFYTKRALLAGVVGATVLYWLDDQSPDSEDSFTFLDRRIEDIISLQAGGDKLKARARELACELGDPFHLFRGDQDRPK
ncbi:MAG: COQ9 family protein [Alphaproteobacteria bacterium]